MQHVAFFWSVQAPEHNTPHVYSRFREEVAHRRPKRGFTPLVFHKLTPSVSSLARPPGVSSDIHLLSRNFGGSWIQHMRLLTK